MRCGKCIRKESAVRRIRNGDPAMMGAHDLLRRAESESEVGVIGVGAFRAVEPFKNMLLLGIRDRRTVVCDNKTRGGITLLEQKKNPAAMRCVG